MTSDKDRLPWTRFATTLRPPFPGSGRLLAAAMFKNEKFNIAIFTILILLQALGVAAVWTRFQFYYLPIMLGIYFWIGLGTTLYLHRYLTHRGFEMPGWLKFIFATGSAIAVRPNARSSLTWRRSVLDCGRLRALPSLPIRFGNCPIWTVDSI